MPDPTIPEQPHDEAEELLPWYVTGQLDATERERVEAHLADCASCRDEFVLERRRMQALRSFSPQVESGWIRLREGITGPERSAPRAKPSARQAAANFWMTLTRPVVLAFATVQTVLLTVTASLLWMSWPTYQALGSASTSAFRQCDRHFPRRCDGAGRPRGTTDRWCFDCGRTDGGGRVPHPCRAAAESRRLGDPAVEPQNRTRAAHRFRGRQMSRLLRLVAICLGATIALAPATSAPESPGALPEHQILVMVRHPPDHYRASGAYGGGYGDELARSARERLARRIAKHIRADGRRGLADADDRRGLLRHGRAQTPVRPRAAAEQLSHDPDVGWAEPMHLYSAQGGAISHNDPLYAAEPAAAEWHLADLHRLATGRGTSVAVIDSGIDAHHPDLAGQFVSERQFRRRPTVGCRTAWHGGRGNHCRQSRQRPGNRGRVASSWSARAARLLAG